MRTRALGPLMGVLAAGAAVVGCGGSKGTTLDAQVTSWANSSGFSAALPRLRGDLARITTAARGAPLRTACDVLVTDSLSDNEQLPTPDATLTAGLSRAYSSAAGAGHACFDGAAGDLTLLARASSERARALTELVEAEARYDAVTSSLPGATT